MKKGSEESSRKLHAGGGVLGGPEGLGGFQQPQQR